MNHQVHKDCSTSILVLPNEVLYLIIENHLTESSRLAFGNTCRRGRILADPLTILSELKRRGTALTYLHLTKRTSNNTWVCYHHGKRHFDLLHPAFASDDYLKNLKQWQSQWIHDSLYLVSFSKEHESKVVNASLPDPTGFDKVRPSGAVNGLPTCRPKEILQYLNLLDSPCDARFIRGIDMEDSMETELCGIAVTKTVEFLQLTRNSTESCFSRLRLKQDQAISCHTKYKIVFKTPRGGQRLTIQNTLKHAKGIKLDICQHNRMNGDEDDYGNAIFPMLRCSASHFDPDVDVDLSNHQQCFEVVDGFLLKPIAKHWMKCVECFTEIHVHFQAQHVLDSKIVQPSVEIESWTILSELPKRIWTNASKDWRRRIGPIERTWRDYMATTSR